MTIFIAAQWAIYFHCCSEYPFEHPEKEGTIYKRRFMVVQIFP